jgi:hypothetical protein
LSSRRPTSTTSTIAWFASADATGGALVTTVPLQEDGGRWAGSRAIVPRVFPPLSFLRASRHPERADLSGRGRKRQDVSNPGVKLVLSLLLHGADRDRTNRLQLASLRIDVLTDSLEDQICVRARFTDARGGQEVCCIRFGGTCGEQSRLFESLCLLYRAQAGGLCTYNASRRPPGRGCRRARAVARSRIPSSLHRRRRPGRAGARGSS